MMNPEDVKKKIESIKEYREREDWSFSNVLLRALLREFVSYIAKHGQGKDRTIAELIATLWKE
jgi:hemerythrin